MMRDSLAVVDDTSFYWYSTDEESYMRYKHGGISSLEGLLAMSKRCGFTHVWAVAGSLLADSFNLPEWKQVSAEWNMVAPPTTSFLSARQARETNEDMLYVGFPRPVFSKRLGRTLQQYLSWPWDGVEKPKVLLDTVINLEAALNLPLQWTPASMGLDFIRDVSARNWSWWQPMRTDLEEHYQISEGVKTFLYDQVCPELHWKAGVIFPKKYLHKIDKNSTHPAGCTGLALGEGEPIFVEPGPDIECSPSHPVFDGLRPGFWECDVLVNKSVRFDGRVLPSFAGHRWLTTPMIMQLRKVGYAVLINQGVYWEKFHQTLRAPMTRLWELRLEWRERRELAIAAENAYQSIGGLLHAIPGKLGDSDSRQTHFRRRDMWAMIVSKSTSTIIYNMQEMEGKFGVRPVLIDVDAFWILSDEPDVQKVLPGYLSAEKLGGWKHVYSLEWRDEFVTWFDTLSSGKIVTRLNGLAKEGK